MIFIETIRGLIKNEKYEYYSHAVTEAKKDGVEPEDIVYVLLTGKIIERYPERYRVLVCDYSDEDLIYITTVYIPSKEEWTHNFQRRRRR